MNTDEPGAIAMFVDRQRTFINENDHTWLCLHKTASGGRAQDIASYFATNADMHSTHYIVGQDGTVVQCVQEIDGAGGNCCLENGHPAFLPLGVNLNVKTISIEHVDPAPDNSTPLTDAQKAASFRLIYNICQRHNIPMRPGDAHGGIIGHNDIAPQSRARCPGNYPWTELYTFLGGNQLLQLSDPMGKFFSQKDANTWHCATTNADLAYAHLDFYRQHSGVFGLPLSGEVYLEQFINDKGDAINIRGTAIMIYERAIAIYDPKRLVPNEAPPGAGNVYLLHADSGVGQQIIAKPLVVALNEQLASLKAELATKGDTAPLQAKITELQNIITAARNELSTSAI